MAQRTAQQLALVGFIITIVHGLGASAGFNATLSAALPSLAVLFCVGWAGGAAWQWAFETRN